MEWLAYSGWVLLSLLGITILFFFSKEYYRIKNNNVSWANLLVVGSFIGASLLLVVLYLTLLSPSVSIIVIPVLIYIMLFIVFLDKRLALVIAPFVTLITFVLVKDYTVWYYYIPLFEILFSLVLSYAIVSSESFKRNGTKIFVFVLVIISISLFFNYLAFLGIREPDDFYASMLATIMFYSLLAIAGTFSFVLVQKLYRRVFDLEKTIFLDDLSLYKAMHAISLIKKEITDNGIQKGLYFLFEIPHCEKGLKKKIITDLRSKFIQENNEMFFFKQSSESIAAFCPFNNMNEETISLAYSGNKGSRQERDIFRKYEDILHSISEQYNVGIKCSTSFYGITSVDFQKLFEYCSFVLKQSENFFNKNLITFEYRTIQEKLKEKYDVINLYSFISDYKIHLLKSAMNGEKIIYPMIKKKTNKLTLLNDEMSKFTPEERSTILSYFALETLKLFASDPKYKKFKLMFFYSKHKLSSPNFDVEAFCKKIQNYNLLEKTIICIDLFEDPKLNEHFAKNLSFLKEHSIAISLFDNGNINEKVFKTIKPDYIKLDTEISLGKVLLGNYKAPSSSFDFGRTPII